MNILELHYMGGPLFMSILSITFLVILFLSGRSIYMLYSGSEIEGVQKSLFPIIQLGIFAAVFGIFGQCLGLFQAFMAIEAAGDISPAMIAGGLKVSMITTLYGLIILLVSLLIWIILRSRAKA